MYLKIIHLISSLKRGGRERQLSTIICNTDLVRYSSKIIYFNESSITYIEEYKLADKSVLIHSRGFFLRLLQLHKFLKNENPDIVYTWGIIESVFILLLNPFHKFKFINGSIRHGIRSKKFSHYFRTLILHLSKYVVANSKAGLKANNLKKGYVLYNGIGEKFIGMIPKEQKLERRKKFFNIDERYTLLISVANLVPYKDYFSILSALKIIKERGYTFYYIILGDGPLKKNIEQKIIEYNLINDIKILGNVQNVNEYLQLADVLIHSSKGEGCSNTILEAMAAGLPIIASNTGGTSEIVSPDNCFLFEYKNYNQLYEIIKKCFNEPSIINKMGYYSIKAIKEKFTVKVMMNNYYKLMNEYFSG
jgi:glycosyltransferase involved in cell wall biosynthesis